MGNKEGVPYRIKAFLGFVSPDADGESRIPVFSDYSGGIKVLTGEGKLIQAPKQKIIARDGEVRLPQDVSNRVDQQEHVIFTVASRSNIAISPILFADKIVEEGKK